MVKCPRGTSSQIKANFASLNKPAIFNLDSTCFSWVYDPSKGQMVNIEEKDSESLNDDLEELELDSNKADKRCPPTSRDELVYFFISCFLDILLESWEGKPCVKPILEHFTSSSKDLEMAGEDLGPCDCSLVSSTAYYLRDLYQKRSCSLSKERLKKASETTESEYLNEEDFCSCVSLDPLNAFVPDEDIHCVFKNGVWYKGRVSRRLMEGEGYYFWEDGTSYQGEFEGGYVTGKGRLEFPDLSVYEGGVYKAFRHGEGMYCFSDSPVTYSGEWWLGKKHGNGLIVYNDPSEGHNFYKGQWQDGFKEGFGFRQYPSGAKYTGFWSNGKRNGKGVMFWTNNDVYRGEWKDGLMHGYGEYTWNTITSKSLTHISSNIYRGYWEYGKRNGRGLFELKNGPLIETNWVDDMKEGFGAVICENGFVVASERMFHNDKPALPIFNENDKNFCTQRGSKSLKKKTEPPRHSSKEKSVAPISIPILAPVYMLNLNPYLQKLLSQQRGKFFKSFQESQLENLMTQKEKCLEEGSVKLDELIFGLTEDQENKLMEIKGVEEHRLRNFIILKMFELRNCYDYYARLASEEDISFECTLIRLFLWQIFIDAEISQWSLSLIDIDCLIAAEDHILIDSPHNPFERIQFWQFIQILITLSWHLYGQYVFGETPLVEDIKITNFLTCYENLERKNVLKTAFEYFIVNNVFRGRFSENWCPPCNKMALEEINLAPMKAMYFIYCSIGEPHSARDFLNAVCQKENEEEKPRIVRYFENRFTYVTLCTICRTGSGNTKTYKIKLIAMTYRFEDLIIREKLPFFKIQGKNVLTVAGDVQHVTEKEPFNFPEILQLEEKKVYVDPKSELTCFNDLKAKRVVKCLVEICPGIIIDDFIVNINYQVKGIIQGWMLSDRFFFSVEFQNGFNYFKFELTFLEFYKAIILCTKLQLKLKVMNGIKDDLIANFKIQMEDYKKQLVEFEKMKESNALLRKKSRVFPDVSKKGKK